MAFFIGLTEFKSGGVWSAVVLYCVLLQIFNKNTPLNIRIVLIDVFTLLALTSAQLFAVKFFSQS